MGGIETTKGGKSRQRRCELGKSFNLFSRGLKTGSCWSSLEIREFRTKFKLYTEVGNFHLQVSPCDDLFSERICVSVYCLGL